LDITAFAMHPTIHNFFAMGASNGVVKFLKASNQLNLSSAEIIFKGDRPIRSLNFNESGELLGITTDEELPIIYCLNNKRLYKLSTAHEGFVINIFFGRNSHIATLGAEGNLHLYSIQMSGEQESNEED
jgi:WD40 repeat protein